MRRLGLLLTFALLLAACSGESEPTAEPVPAATEAPAATSVPEPTATPEPTPIPVEPLRMNHIQVIGSHNSYHLVPDDPIYAAVLGLAPALAESIQYSHVSLTEQLETYGIRQFELDVYADPEGSLYDTPAVNGLLSLGELEDPLLDEPGYKVLHTQDYDFGTNCLTLVVCLEEIESWSAANPNHLPINIMIEFKSQSVPAAAAAAGLELPVELPWVVPLAPTASLLDDLDAEIRSVFDADQMIQPDDVRGDAATLEEAVLTQGWPLLDDARGKVFFTMTNGEDVRSIYVQDAPSLEGRVIFIRSRPGLPDAAYVQFGEPGIPGLDEAVEAGYLVRTRTDEPTGDARENDVTQRDAALASGAHFLSTDYYAPSELFDSPYVVALPGGAVARCNPVSAPPTCADKDLTE